MRKLSALPAVPRRYAATVPLALAGALVAALTPVGLAPVATVVLLGVVGLACWTDGHRVAWWWGFLLPLDFIDGVPLFVLDAARYGAVLWLCVLFRPDISSARMRYVVKLAVLVGAVAIVRLAGSLARTDRFGIMIAGVMLIGALTAPLIARRVAAHVSVVAGFLAGVLFSAVIAVMQLFDLPTLREGNMEGSRFPGLSSTTMVLTWDLALGLLVAGYFLLGTHHRRLHRATALAMVPVGLFALVANGAQGGIMGLGAAAFAVLCFSWRRLSWRTAAPYVAGAFGVVAVLAVTVVAFDISTPTLDGWFGEGDYGNELARWEVARDGFREMVAHPVAGTGRTNFEDQYGLAPHFLPLEAGVTSGILGFAVAAYLLWYLLTLVAKGPIGRRPAAWLGLTLAAARGSSALIVTGGPFVGLPRFSLLLIATVAMLGEPWPVDGPVEVAADEPATDADAAADAH